MMIEWNSFSAFDDARELEHVVDLLHDWADSGQIVSKQNPPHNRYDFETGEKSYLWARLCLQEAETIAILERESPGLYPRTDIADNFYKLFFDLEYVAEKPFLLTSRLSDIVLRLHKALIYAHEVFDPVHRNALIANERTKAESIDDEKIEQALAARNSKLQSERGKLSKRGPSQDSGRSLVNAVRTSTKKRAWTAAWSWLVDMAESQQLVKDFELLSGNEEVVCFRKGGRERSLKRSTFEGYWPKKS